MPLTNQSTDYEVIVSRSGVPCCEYEVSAPSRAAAALRVRVAREDDNTHEHCDTYDAAIRLPRPQYAYLATFCNFRALAEVAWGRAL